MARGPYGYRRGGPQPRGRMATLRRFWPLALAAWRRWDDLTPQQKERYKRMASDYSRRGRDAVNQRSQQRRRP